MNTATTKTEKNAAHYQKVKSHVVTIRLDEQSKAEFEALRKASNLSNSALIKNLLKKIQIKAPNPKASESIVRELRAWGNNFNQAMRIANEANKKGFLNIGGLTACVKEAHAQLKQIEEKL